MGISRTTLACGVVLMFAIAVLCPAARGDALALFTTTVTSEDTWHGKSKIGPVAGPVDVSTEYNGDAYIPAWGFSAPYAVEVDTHSETAYKLSELGTLDVGELESSGLIAGYDSIQVKGEVNFSMTIGSIKPPPYPALLLPIRFAPSISVDCETHTWTWPTGSATSMCNADATASIMDISEPISTGSWGSVDLPQRGEGSTFFFSSVSSSPDGYISYYKGDTLSITLTTDVVMGGVVFGCRNAPDEPWYLCGPELTAGVKATVDPLFEFDQQAFDALMGPDAYPLSEYYKFEPSPNAVPEPCSLLLVATGLAGICLAALRKK